SSFWSRTQSRKSFRRFYLVLRAAGLQSIRGARRRPPLRGGYWTIARQVLDLFDASCGFAGDSFRDWRNLDVERLLNYELGGEIIIAWCESKRPTFSNDLAQTGK